jgi:hypothetical protein
MNQLLHEILMSEFERTDRQLNVGFRKRNVEVVTMKNNQQVALYRLIYYSKSAVHVSGNVFVHYQEHLTVFTVSGSVYTSCCRLAAGRNLGEH